MRTKISKADDSNAKALRVAVGKRILKLIKENKFDSPGAFANVKNINRTKVWRLTRGKRGGMIESYFEIAKALGLSLEQLFEGVS